MAENTEVILTPEQKHVLDEVEVMVLEAISERCAGCSTANFAPSRFGMAVALGRTSKNTATSAAKRFSTCTGLSEENGVQMCHLHTGRQE